MSSKKYLILLCVAVFAAAGDVCLGRGMRDFGAVSMSNIGSLLTVLVNPWILGGIGLLILFFGSYLTALSWADLTYVLPATAISYVLMAFFARILLHEHVTANRWLGILLITAGVGFVATGPERTPQISERTSDSKQSARAIAGGER